MATLRVLDAISATHRTRIMRLLITLDYIVDPIFKLYAKRLIRSISKKQATSCVESSQPAWQYESHDKAKNAH